jgi:hypothetical protein
VRLVSNYFAHVSILPPKIAKWFQISVENAKIVLIVIKKTNLTIEIDTTMPKRRVSITL